ncbi:MAG: leucine-rich repeat domain-containing protein [Clostridia bacterium]|nr:leucine-rich repeat domain-containing protein [Clostridia bacterium]
MKNWKKIALLLALCLLLCCSAVFASAEAVSGVAGDFAYSIPYGTYAVITGYTGEGGQIDIPAAIEGVPVTSISSSAFADVREKVTDVTIPASVTKFTSAFAGCANLNNVTIMEGVTAISAGAFKDCASLTEVVIPEGVTTIGADAFSGCGALTSVSLPASLERAIGIGLEAVQGVYFAGTEAQWSALANQLALPASAAVFFADGSQSAAEAPAETPAYSFSLEAAKPADEDVHTHDWVDGPDTATCTAGGQIISTCSICGATETVYTTAKGHSVTPSFKENNTIVLTCTRCGKEYTGERINGIQWPASARDAATVCANRGYHLCKLIERTATCTKGGLSESITCATCGAVLEGSYEIGPRGHWFRDWQVIDEGTCITEGKKQRTCRNCSYVEVKNTGYNLTRHYVCQNVGFRAPTCAQTGYTGDNVCIHCGRIVVSGNVLPKSSTHGATEIRDITTSASSSTGYAGNLYCKVCGQIIQKNVEAPAPSK